MKRLLTLILALMLVLCACQAAQEPEETTLVPTGDPTEATEATDPTEKPTQAPTQPSQDTQPQPAYQNPLNGQGLAEPFTGRPVAVMLNNLKAAMPQHGVSQADILYEVLAEGGVTRCMGVFSDISQVEKVGSIRSSRKYYVDIARSYGAAYVHAGGSDEALNYLTGLKTMDLDAAQSATYFYRDQDRLNAGYSLEHTLFSSGEMILNYANERGVPTELDGEKGYNLSFDDGTVTVGETAEKVTVYFNMGGKPTSYTKSTVLTYNAETKTYFAQQHGGDYIDGNTNEAISFRNVVVLHMATSLQSDNYHLTVENVGSGTGYFFCNGQKVQIRWSRSGVEEPFRYTLENGQDVTFCVGSTYVGVIPTNAAVTWE